MYLSLRVHGSIPTEGKNSTWGVEKIDHGYLGHHYLKPIIGIIIEIDRTPLPRIRRVGALETIDLTKLEVKGVLEIRLYLVVRSKGIGLMILEFSGLKEEAVCLH